MGNSFSDKSDTELWALLKSGNQDAFSAIYQRHIQFMYNYGLKLTADQGLLKDVLQELFTDFWMKRASLSDVNQLNIYLIKSLRYKLLKAIAKTSVQKSSLSLDDLLKEIQFPDIIENELSTERRDRLKAGLDLLPERQREIIYLKYYQNLDNQQISEIVNINYQSVSNLLQRAIINLKKKIFVA